MFGSAVVSLYWLAGGAGLLDTLGGSLERFARQRTAGGLAILVLVVLVNVVAGLLAICLLGAPAARFGR